MKPERTGSSGFRRGFVFDRFGLVTIGKRIGRCNRGEFEDEQGGVGVRGPREVNRQAMAGESMGRKSHIRVEVLEEIRNATAGGRDCAYQAMNPRSSVSLTTLPEQ